MIFLLFFYVLFYIFAVYSTSQSRDYQQKALIVTCVVLAFIVGFRNYGWPDTTVYTSVFEIANKDVFNASLHDEFWGYVERGFFHLGSIVKTFTDNATAYLLFISLLTFFVIYKFTSKYCIFPLLGICDYIARFIFNRNFIQIRSALAIAVIMLALQYIKNKDIWRFLAIIGIAYLFHHASLLALPLYIFAYYRPKRRHILYGIAISFVLAYSFAPLVSNYVEDWSTDLHYDTYVTTEYIESAKGLNNPLIYLQLLVLLIFTYQEKKLAQISPYYYVIRDTYFYSTCILIIFCNYSALSGRTSTIFATVEMMIVPMLALSFRKENRLFYYFATGLILIIFFYQKLILMQPYL